VKPFVLGFVMIVNDVKMCVFFLLISVRDATEITEHTGCCE